MRRLWNAECHFSVYRLKCWIKFDVSAVWRWVRSFSWPNVCHSWPDLLGACMCWLCELCVARYPPPDLWDYSNLCWLIWLIRFISTRPQSSHMRFAGGGGLGREGAPRGGWCIVGAMIFFFLFCFELVNIFLERGDLEVAVMSVNVNWTWPFFLVIKQKLRETVIQMDLTDLRIFCFLKQNSN